MEIEFITKKIEETKKLGRLLAQELRGGEVVCLFGELGAGKTTFTQGLLEGLKVEKPYTSPTFIVMKEYKVKNNRGKGINKKEIDAVYHFDAYRVGIEDILNLGWEEITTNEKNICVIEWADKLKKIIPSKSLWVSFEWLDEEKRKIIIREKFQKIQK